VDHEQFRSISAEMAAERMGGRVAVDLRGAWNRCDWRAAGFTLHVLGVGSSA
jgi:hypothetical protein